MTSSICSAPRRAGSSRSAAAATASSRPARLPNAQGNYQYAYAGLGALSGFSTSTSADNGHTLTSAGLDTNGGVTSNGALADRQWATFTDDNTVLLTYNQQEPRNTVVIKSTDGGLTYSPACGDRGARSGLPGADALDPVPRTRS